MKSIGLERKLKKSSVMNRQNQPVRYFSALTTQVATEWFSQYCFVSVPYATILQTTGYTTFLEKSGKIDGRNLENVHDTLKPWNVVGSEVGLPGSAVNCLADVIWTSYATRDEVTRAKFPLVNTALCNWIESQLKLMQGSLSRSRCWRWWRLMSAEESGQCVASSA